jgi:hypothetical protein
MSTDLKGNRLGDECPEQPKQERRPQPFKPNDDGDYDDNKDNRGGEREGVIATKRDDNGDDKT